MNSRTQAVSRYQAWAKLRSEARFNLAVSGIPDYPLAELPMSLNDIEIGGTGPYGFLPLMQRLSAKAGVAEECLVYTVGTSMANFVALTALVAPGDEVLVERPTYEPILAVLDHLGANVSRFERRADRGFRLGLGELERRITEKIRLVVLCNLHNPSSAFTDEDTMLQVGEMASKVGAPVLVDEVYLETLFDRPWRSAFHLGPNFDDQQSSEGLRAQWPALRMDSSSARSGAAHVAGGGLHLWKPGASGGMHGRGCARPSGSSERSRTQITGDESAANECLSV